MRNPENSETADESSDREAAEMLSSFAEQVSEDLDKEDLDNQATADEVIARTRLERLIHAQLMALQAIYHELRHGHEQAARQTTALAAHAKALEEHADTMDELRRALLGHADALSLYRRRD